MSVSLFLLPQSALKPEGYRMIKRIEFTLNLEDPQEAAIYRALRPSLLYRRGGAVIRQALDEHLVSKQRPSIQIHQEEKIYDEQA